MLNRILSRLSIRKLKIPLIIMAIFAISSLSVLELRRYLYTQHNRISCYANVNIHKDDKILSLRLRYLMQKGNGMIFLQGKLYENGESAGIISRNISFDYIQSGSFYKIYVEDIVNLSQSTIFGEKVDAFLPDIWYQKGIRSGFFIQPQYPNGYIFGRYFLPSFYCRNIDD
ncbi:hypothetical protein ABQ333_12675 [Serratia fonticola]|uniref:hypothetical protein n=1 Tax=Serratia fonticola TaxID=47917 RepID=UPI003AAB97EC